MNNDGKFNKTFYLIVNILQYHIKLKHVHTNENKHIISSSHINCLVQFNAQNGIQSMLLKLEIFLVSLYFPGARNVVVFERIHNAHFIHKT